MYPKQSASHTAAACHHLRLRPVGADGAGGRADDDVRQRLPRSHPDALPHRRLAVEHHHPDVALLRPRADLLAEVLQEGRRGHPDVAVAAVRGVHADRLVHLLHDLVLPRHPARPRLPDGLRGIVIPARHERRWDFLSQRLFACRRARGSLRFRLLSYDCVLNHLLVGGRNQ